MTKERAYHAALGGSAETWAEIQRIEAVKLAPRLPDRRYALLHQRCAAGTITEDERAELDLMCAMKEAEAGDA